MDNQISNESEDRWINDRLGKLAPPSNWQPHADRALERLMQRQRERHPRWVRLSMAGGVVVVVGVIVGMLPWTTIWKTEPKDPANQTAPVEAPREATPPIAAETIDPQVNAPAANGRVIYYETDVPAPLSVARPIPPPVPELPPELSARIRPKKEWQTARGVLAHPEIMQQSQETGTSEPVVVSQVRPEYTEEAKKARITGVVELVCTVNTDGSVTVDRIGKSLGYGLDESARDAVSQWKFVPAKKDGVPVSKTITMNIAFGLK